MYLKKIRLKNFRNYSEISISFCNGINLIVGNNAQGKTNLLEAALYLSQIKSFRLKKDKELVLFSEQQAQIEGEIEAFNRQINLLVNINYEGKKELFKNQIKQKRFSDVAGLLKAVIFCPDDLLIIKEGAQARRRLIDDALCQLRPKYYDVLSEFRKNMAQKLEILQSYDQNPSLLSMLPDFNARLCDLGATIIRLRASYIKGLAARAGELHRSISGDEELSIFYKTVKTVSDPYGDVDEIKKQLIRHQNEHYNAELASKSCLSGPHKDDIEIYINDQNTKSYSSQGQIRTAMLSLKLAERELLCADCGEYPLLLLDDVLSELDEKRRDFILNKISTGQVIITSCEPEVAKQFKSGKIFKIENNKAYEKKL